MPRRPRSSAAVILNPLATRATAELDRSRHTASFYSDIRFIACRDTVAAIRDLPADDRFRPTV
jgi:hypothetical protein